ncbi:hypothetical protein TNCV_3651091 [Trichonephila clavipes]|nr:hypothetical protein TNCV_3651091 [Trichonephila clavipes]
MSVVSQPAYFAHANVFHHEGKASAIELSIADSQGWQRSANHVHHRESCRANFQVQRFSIQLPRECPSSSGTPPVTQECARGIPALLRRGKFSQLARNIGLMVVKGGEQQKKIFKELGLYAMALENLPKFKDICDVTFPNPVHEGVHEEEDISYCTVLKSYQFCQIHAAV